MVTELSRYNLGVAFFKTLISRSYLINFLITGGFLWLKRTVCYLAIRFASNHIQMTTDTARHVLFSCNTLHIYIASDKLFR